MNIYDYNIFKMFFGTILIISLLIFVYSLITYGKKGK